MQTSGSVRPRPLWLAIPASLVLAGSTLLMLRRVEPFTTWYYLWAWYPTLALLDCAVAARTGRYFLIDRARAGFAVSLFAWSAVAWFVFELINFRIQNWYYVFLPPERPVRWAGTVLAFATVLPAIFLAERWLDATGIAEDVRWPRFSVTSVIRRAAFVIGVGFVALSLAWPRVFFPLVWGALSLLLEPWNHRPDAGPSLLGNLAAGRPGRPIRLLLAGLGIGFIWELFNIAARAKWVYTVPGFDSLKLFEMPLPGFLGFPVFALDCFVIYQCLVLSGVAVPAEPAAGATPTRLRPVRTAAAALGGVVFAIGVLLGMDRWNTDSYTPELDGLSVASSEFGSRLADTRFADVFELARSRPQEVARAVGAPRELARRWTAAARLATLREIGTVNARLLDRVGIGSVEALAQADPAELSRRMRALTDRPHAATPAKARVWVRAARRAVTTEPGAGGPGSQTRGLEEAATTPW